MAKAEQLKDRWSYLYAHHLPSLAKAKDDSQPRWPVHLDHCFARIVLDNAVGIDRPWTEVVKSPAVKNMTEQQFAAAITLAEEIASGRANLIELDERSLQLRGKKSKQPVKRSVAVDEADARASKKRRGGDQTISSYFLPSPSSPQPKEHLAPDDGEERDEKSSDIANGESQDVDMPVQLKRIKDSTLTPFRKQTLSMLCRIPRGRYSTYQAMSDHISRTSHKTCARAVGNAMRNNPFAPEVPCHRILAADGSLGGFGGHWGEEGKFASKKHELLEQEGVRFDSRGKVKGPVFREWKE